MPFSAAKWSIMPSSIVLYLETSSIIITGGNLSIFLRSTFA
jgi:hypothetical protein